eukprot:TRINITY_DN530_c0_g1_i1.p1 TRINITY_DN530_c0_g1~~TRINITY_DN530_c0_g1_i1.p1  ORF type:complete len:804 (+),score=230.74 TRINITY_DN530_c0_g1_i1:37-2448(+)
MTMSLSPEQIDELDASFAFNAKDTLILTSILYKVFWDLGYGLSEEEILKWTNTYLPTALGVEELPERIGITQARRAYSTLLEHKLPRMRTTPRRTAEPSSPQDSVQPPASSPSQSADVSVSPPVHTATGSLISAEAVAAAAHHPAIRAALGLDDDDSTTAPPSAPAEPATATTAAATAAEAKTEVQAEVEISVITVREAPVVSDDAVSSHVGDQSIEQLTARAFSIVSGRDGAVGFEDEYAMQAKSAVQPQVLQAKLQEEADKLAEQEPAVTVQQPEPIVADTAAVSQAETTAADSDADDAAAKELAATTIQKHVKGHLARKHLDAASKGDAVEQPQASSEEHQEHQEQQEQQTAQAQQEQPSDLESDQKQQQTQQEQQEVAVDQQQLDTSQAAITIQKHVKGYLTRKHLEPSTEPSSDSAQSTDGAAEEITVSAATDDSALSEQEPVTAAEQTSAVVTETEPASSEATATTTTDPADNASETALSTTAEEAPISIASVVGIEMKTAVTTQRRGSRSLSDHSPVQPIATAPIVPALALLLAKAAAASEDDDDGMMMVDERTRSLSVEDDVSPARQESISEQLQADHVEQVKIHEAQKKVSAEDFLRNCGILAAYKEMLISIAKEQPRDVYQYAADFMLKHARPVHAPGTHRDYRSSPRTHRNFTKSWESRLQPSKNPLPEQRNKYWQTQLRNEVLGSPRILNPDTPGRRARQLSPIRNKDGKIVPIAEQHFMLQTAARVVSPPKLPLKSPRQLSPLRNQDGKIMPIPEQHYMARTGEVRRDFLTRSRETSPPKRPVKEPQARK